MHSQLQFILIASFGAFCQEVIHWFELRTKLTTKKVRALVGSKWYWIITVLTICISGLGVFLLFYDQIPDKRNIQFLMGASFPLIFKKLVQTQRFTQQLGDGTSFSDIFKMYIE